MAHVLRTAVTLVLALAVPSFAEAADPNKKKLVLPNLGLGNVGGELPKADGLKKPSARPATVAPKVTTSDVEYTVLKVEHATVFARTATGAKPQGGVLPAVMLSGDPPTTQPFTTLVKVKATQKVNASIELVILDPRGDTALSGAGELDFRNSKTDDVEYLIDWAPVARPSGGTYQILVRIAGQPMGTWPLKVEKR
ncbi:MAG: hypothetical protein WBV82_00345 [Myxococcaceae bacterium]